jgi:poly(A) polymerase
MTEPIAPTSKQPCTRADALAVLKRLRDAGHVAYFAGGCVRDELLAITPKDYDIATDAPPQRVQELFRSTQAVGAAFGVILVRHAKSVVEVATFRSDGAYLDGRRPSEVHFTNAEEDAKRRDFTINGLFLDPVENRVIDYVAGQSDLKAKVLRAIGDPAARFGEDYLRLLRAIRFAARFELQIEPETSNAIRARAKQLASISPERIADELRLMFAPPSRNRALALLREYALLEVIMRFSRPPWGEGGLAIFDALGAERVPLGLALAAVHLTRERVNHELLLRPDSIREFARAMRQALRFSNEESEDLEGTLDGVRMLLLGGVPLGLASKKRFLARSTSPLSRRLMSAMSQAGVWKDRIDPLMKELDDLAKTNFAPAPLLTGDDLVAAGWRPGPLFKRVLDQVYDAQLEDRVTSKEQAMELAKTLQGAG